MTLSPLDHVDDGLLPRWVAMLRPAAELAAQLAATQFVPRDLRGKPEAIAAAILLGDELGLGPMAALSNIHVVEGKPCTSAEVQRALIFRAGHSIVVEHADDARAVVVGKRRDTNVTDRVEWTIGQARAAGLVRPNSGWVKYPRAMLIARATSELARRLFPDAIGGLSYLEEEITSGTTDAPGQTEAPRRVSRRSAPTPATPAAVLGAGDTGEGQATGQDGSGDAHPPLDAGGPPPPASPGPVSAESPQRPEPGPSALPELPSRPATASKAAVNKAHALLNALGIKDRTQRLRLTCLVTGREVSSWSELDAHEVSQLLDVLDNLETGLLRLEWHDETPVLTVPDIEPDTYEERYP